jgi:hypothetical protein
MTKGRAREPKGTVWRLCQPAKSLTPSVTRAQRDLCSMSGVVRAAAKKVSVTTEIFLALGLGIAVRREFEIAPPLHIDA